MLRPAASVVSASPNLELFPCPALETLLLLPDPLESVPNPAHETFTTALNCGRCSKKLNICDVFNHMLVETIFFPFMVEKMFYWATSTKESTLLLLCIINMNVIYQVAPNIRLQFK